MAPASYSNVAVIDFEKVSMCSQKELLMMLHALIVNLGAHDASPSPMQDDR